jgi:hypothetical protein
LEYQVEGVGARVSHLNFWDLVGYAASGLVFAAFCMRAMVPLRILGICSNVAFLAYGMAQSLGPVCVLHAVLLPINGWRLWQAVRGLRQPAQPRASN